MKKPARLVSLDAFRGLTMAGMVIVNNPGDWGHVYPPLLHAQWNGCTPTDLIFPFFLFIVGVSITLSRGTMGDPWQILKRALVIFGLGMVLALYPRWDFSVVRIPGVLQRIAVCYLAAAFLFRWTAPQRGNDDARRWAHGRTLMLWAAGLTLGYWGVMMLVPPPGGVAGDLTPDGNLGAYIDRKIFGAHLWVQSKTWDPEGLLSTVPALATTLLGGVAGLWLGSRAPGTRKALWMVVAGVLAMGLGLVWSLAFPLNKALWTSSYVWFTGGAAAVFLALCFALIDVKGWKAWSRPFVILGLNAIALFVLSGLMTKFLSFHKVTGADGQPVSMLRYIYSTWFVPLAEPINASLLFALANLAVLFVVLWLMDRKGIYLKA
ncbi:MAG: N-acetylglucosamine related transporter, NagX [Acidobacteria bacterium]|nr:N-acetylglucosamine related transporter, NagX [Acidobacteriota bacterium]